MSSDKNSTPRKKIQKMWRPRALLLSGILFSILIIPWKFYPPAKHFWDKVDEQSFWQLNGLLQKYPDIRWITGLCTTHRFDLVTDIFMMLVLYRAVRSERKDDNRRSGLARFTAYAVSTLLLYHTVEYLMVHFIKPNRLSPTLILGGYRLSGLNSSMDIKDSSESTFPGDHTAIVMLWAAYMMTFNSHFFSTFSALFAIFCSIPRLMSGAHWITDDVLGSSALVSAVLGVYYGTPICSVASSIATKLISQASKIKEK